MRKLLRFFGLFLLLLLALALGAYVFRGPLFGPYLIDKVETALAEQLGGRYTVARVEGSWFGDLALVGLRTVEPPPDGPLRDVAFGRAVVTYDLRGLLGDDPLGAIHSITVSNARVDLDLTRESAPDPDDDDATPLLERIPEVLPDIELGGSARIHTAAGDVELDGVGLGTAAEGALAVAVERIGLPERFGPGGALRGTLARAGPVLTWRSTTPVSGIVLADARWDGALAATVRVGNSAIDVTFADGRGRAASGRFDPGDLPAWLARPLRENHAIPLPDRLAFAVDLESLEPLALRARVNADPFDWRGRAVRRLDLDASFRDGRAVVTTARIESDEVAVDVRRLLLEPDRPYLVGAVERLEVRTDDLRVFLPRLDRRLSLTVRATSDDLRTVRLEEARLAGKGVEISGSGQATLAAEPEQWRATTLRGSFAGSVVDFASAGYAMRGTVQLTGDVRGALDALAANVEVTGAGLEVEGRGIERVALRASLRWPVLRVQEAEVVSEAGRVTASGEVDVDARRVRNGAYEVAIDDLGAFLRLFPRAPRATGTVHGSGEVDHDDTGLNGTATLRVENLSWNGRALGAFDLAARATADRIDVSSASGAGDWGRAQARGVVELDERRARVDELRVDVRDAGIVARAPLRIEWAPHGAVVVSDIDVTAFGGRVRGSVRRGDRLDLSLAATAIDLGRVDPRFAGLADASVRAVADEYVVEVKAPDLRFEGEEAEVFLKARQLRGGIEVDRLGLYAEGRIAVEGHAVLPWRFVDGAFVRVDGVEPDVVLHANLQDLGRLLPRAHVNRASVAVRGDAAGLHATVDLDQTSPYAEAVMVQRVRLALTATPAAVSGRIESEGGEAGRLEGVVNVDRGLDWTDPRQFLALAEEGRVDGSLKFSLKDLGILRPLVPSVLHLEGRGAADLALSGPLRGPDVTGTAELHDVDCSIRGAIPPINDGNGRLVFQGRGVRIEEFRAMLGYAPFELEGSVDIGLDAGADAIDLRCRGRNVQLVRNRHLRARADIDLTLTGSVDAPHAAGTVHLTSALYSQPMSILSRGARVVDDKFYLFSFRDGPLSRATFDIQLTADESVRVRNNVMRGNFSTDLQLRGTGLVPRLAGRVFFRETLVELPLTGLKVDQGELRFPQDSPFDPYLRVAAHTRMKGYDLDVMLDGPLSGLDFYVTARPGLSEEDAVLLLTSGYTRAELEGRDSQKAALGSVATYFGQQLLASMSGPSDPDAKTFFDRFAVEIGRDVSRGGKDTVEAEFEVLPRWYLRVEQDRYEDYNGGVVWRLRFR